MTMYGLHYLLRTVKNDMHGPREHGSVPWIKVYESVSGRMCSAGIPSAAPHSHHYRKDVPSNHVIQDKICALVHLLNGLLQ